jgi:hypothetical protein
MKAKEENNLPGVEALSCEDLLVTPAMADWSNGLFESWEYFESNRCEHCEEPVVSGGEPHCDVDSESECKGYVPGCEGPMMNFFYACTTDIDPEQAALAIVDLPLCVVVLEGKTGLALTGGGMDLNWEICEAYMRLGQLPPVHFADLPGIAGRGKSERDKWVLRGCLRSLEVVEGWMAQRRGSVRAMLEAASRGER